MFGFRKKAATAYSVTILRTGILGTGAPVHDSRPSPGDQSPRLPQQQLYGLHNIVDKSDPHHRRSRRPFRYETHTRDHNITILYIYILNVYILVTIYIYSTRTDRPVSSYGSIPHRPITVLGHLQVHYRPTPYSYHSGLSIYNNVASAAATSQSFAPPPRPSTTTTTTTTEYNHYQYPTCS